MVRTALIFSLLLVSPLMAQTQGIVKKLSCPDSLSLDDKLKAIISLEMSGMKMHKSKSSCLMQDKHPYVFVYKDMVLDERDAEIVPVSFNTFKILTKRAGQNGDYQVKFQIKSKDGKVYEDNFNVLLNYGKESIERNGCGSLLDAPKNLYIKKECQ